jgi:hypothetical protein
MHIVGYLYEEEDVCLLRGRSCIFKCNLGEFNTSLDRATAQSFSRRSFTREAQIRSQVHPRELCGGQSGTGTGVPLSASVFACLYHSTSAPHASLPTSRFSGKFTKKQCFFVKKKPFCYIHIFK